jgi:hypothetical protein
VDTPAQSKPADADLDSERSHLTQALRQREAKLQSEKHLPGNTAPRRRKVTITNIHFCRTPLPDNDPTNEPQTFSTL